MLVIQQHRILRKHGILRTIIGIIRELGIQQAIHGTKVQMRHHRGIPLIIIGRQHLHQ